MDDDGPLGISIIIAGTTAWMYNANLALLEADVNERTTRKSVTFLHPFSLAGIDEPMEADTYIVETLEEVIEGLSFVAYRRVSTTIVTTGKGYGEGARQVITIDPRDLEAAQEQDAQTEISMGPLAHLVAR